MKIYNLLLLVLVLTSCAKENDSLVTMEYSQTQCDDNWGNAGETTPVVVVNYYKAHHNIDLQEVTIFVKDSTASVCLACTCTSGKIISAKVPDKNKAVMKTTGFKEK